MSRRMRRSEGKAVVPILIVLVALAGLGAWNYQRNLASEATEEQPRPFRGYQVADLEALQTAYSQEVAAFQKKYDSQDAKRRRASDAGLIDERVDEFARVQQSSSRLRDLRADLAEREARLREIERELSTRSAQLSGLSLHLKRLFTI